jgi:outer membrane protein assembly factor BamB
MKLPFLPLLLATLVAGLACPGPAQKKVTTDAIIQATGIDSGLAPVIADDAALACDLADGGKLQVHLLAGRSESIGTLRAEVQSRGLGGRVVVQALAADGRLPHPDRFVNLVATALDRPDDAEIQRVLAVRGAAYVQRGGKWKTAAKAADAKIDGWFQHWYDATGNCVSHDRVAGFPEAVQWQHGPALEDGTADGKVVRVADGCLVTVDNATGDLVCRDAGNGLLRWRVPAKFEFRDDLAIFGGRIYCYYDPAPKNMDGKSGRRTAAPLAALDLLTGKLVQTYDQAKRMGDEKPVEVEEEGRKDRRNPVPWFVVSDEVIVQAYGAELVVLDRQTGRRRWEQKLDDGTWFSPTVAGDLVLAAETVLPGKRERYDASDEVRAVTAFGLADGRLRWRNDQVHPVRELTGKTLGLFKARAGFKPLTVAEGLVVIHTASYQARYGHTIAVLDATNGRELWQRGYQPGELYDNASQRVVVRAGEVGAEWKKFQDPKLPDVGRGVEVKRTQYAPDLFADDALRFIREHQRQPFFLYLALNTPHANNEAGAKGMEVPDLGKFAAMVRNLDRDTGRMLDLLKELRIAENTLVIFTSDNGPHQEGGHKADFFESNGKYRGFKRDLTEGGIRVPMIAWWPGTIAPGGENDRQWYFGDLMATAAELAGVKPPDGLDSDSFVPALHGQTEKDQWKRKSRLYWEIYEGASAQAVRFGKWKAIRSPMFKGEIELYDMSNDPQEKRTYAVRRPDLTRHATRLLDETHQPDLSWQVSPQPKKPSPEGASR